MYFLGPVLPVLPSKTTATVAVSDWVTNCTALQNNSGVADIYMVPEVSALSRAFWHFLVAAISGTRFTACSAFFAVKIADKNKQEKTSTSETLDLAPENQSAGLRG